MGIAAPSLLTSDHQTDGFQCGNATLDEWLAKRALKNQENGASRTFAICDEERKVIGYYALATGSVEHDLVTSNFSRGMPDPIPVIVLGRLAISENHQGKGLNKALLKDAMLRTISIASNVGVRGLLVHAISVEAKQFYRRYGFTESNLDPMTLMISVKNIIKYL